MEHFKGASLGLAPVLPANIRLGSSILRESVKCSCKFFYSTGPMLGKTRKKSFITVAADQRVSDGKADHLRQVEGRDH